MTREAERLLEIVEREGIDSDEEEEQVPGFKKSVPTAPKPTASDEAVFAQSYIPRALDQVYDPERDVARVLRGEGESLIYADITGVASIHSKVNNELESLPEGTVRFADGHILLPKGNGDLDDVEEEDEEGKGEGEEEDDESDGGDGSGSDEDERRPRGKKHEDRDEKKVCLISLVDHRFESGLLTIFLDPRQEEMKQKKKQEKREVLKCQNQRRKEK